MEAGDKEAGVMGSNSTDTRGKIVFAFYVGASLAFAFIGDYFYQCKLFNAFKASRITGIAVGARPSWSGDKLILNVPTSVLPYDNTIEVFRSYGCVAIWAVVIVGICIGISFIFCQFFDCLSLVLLAAASYVFLPLLLDWFGVYSDALGLKTVTLFLMALILIYRGAILFKPHLALSRLGDGDDAAKAQDNGLTQVIKTYHLYFTLTLGVAGVVSTTFLFGLASLAKNMLAAQANEHGILEIALCLYYSWSTVIGLIGVALVAQRFHLKLQDTLLAMGKLHSRPSPVLGP